MITFSPGKYIVEYREVLQEAWKRYDIATAAWHREVANGGIQKLDPMIPEDSDELAKGAQSKCTTPAAVSVASIWRRCKAELDAAAKNVQEALADLAAQRPDTRLPVEREPGSDDGDDFATEAL